MYYVYLLQSKGTGKIYTGFSANLRQRIRQHKGRSVHTTKRMGKIELIFYEAFACEKDARRREIYLKTTKGKKAVRLMLREYLRSNQQQIVGPIV